MRVHAVRAPGRRCARQARAPAVWAPGRSVGRGGPGQGKPGHRRRGRLPVLHRARACWQCRDHLLPAQLRDGPGGVQVQVPPPRALVAEGQGGHHGRGPQPGAGVPRGREREGLVRGAAPARQAARVAPGAAPAPEGELRGPRALLPRGVCRAAAPAAVPPRPPRGAGRPWRRLGRGGGAARGPEPRVGPPGAPGLLGLPRHGGPGRVGRPWARRRGARRGAGRPAAAGPGPGGGRGRGRGAAGRAGPAAGAAGQAGAGGSAPRLLRGGHRLRARRALLCRVADVAGSHLRDVRLAGPRGSARLRHPRAPAGPQRGAGRLRGLPRPGAAGGAAAGPARDRAGAAACVCAPPLLRERPSCHEHLRELAARVLPGRHGLHDRVASGGDPRGRPLLFPVLRGDRGVRLRVALERLRDLGTP
mmetsp:Transcript_24167/g.64631  ORF Transcript_24167/g.64631 Transcript_24167/m.64631 type:complete len:418 (+) Transcript_24167:484-1737(+)